MAGRRIGEAFVAVKADTSGTGAEVERELGKELDGAGKKSGKKFGKSFGDEVLKAVTGSSGLNSALKALHLDPIDIKASPRDALKAIEETELKLKALSGDATTVEVKVRTEKARADLARFRKQLGDVGEAAGSEAAAGVEKGFAGLPAAVGPPLIGVIIGAAPLIGATLSAAVIGGAAGAGIVGGVLLAVRDARVQSAGKELGQRLLGSLEQDAAPFVQPLLDAIDLVDSRFRESQSTIRSIFAGASRFVIPLVDGITRGVQAIMRGVDNAVQHAGPVIDVLGRGIAQLGVSIEAFLNRISQNAPAAAVALQAVFNIVDLTIRTIALGIDVLTRVYGFAAKTGLLGAEAQAQFIAYEADAKIAKQTTADLGATFQAAAPKASALNTAIAPIAPNLQDIAAATRAVHTANADLFSSETAVAQAIADATAKVKANGKTLDTNSQKGRENRQALSQVASALQTQYDKYVQVNGVGSRSAAVADNLRGQFIRLARQAGLSAGAAKRLADSILDIPSSHDTRITARNAKALEAAREVRRAINSLPSSKVIDVAIRVTGTRAPRSAVAAALAKQSLPGRAAGGRAERGMAYVVGERRPELFVPDTDGTIFPDLSQISGGRATPGPSMDRVEALLAEIVRALHKVAPEVGAHVNRAVRSVDAGIGATADLYARGAW